MVKITILSIMTTDYLTIAKSLADQVHADGQRLASEYQKPVLDVLLAEPAGGWQSRERINRLQGRIGRNIKRAEVCAAISLSQRLDDLFGLLDQRLQQLVDAMFVEDES